VRWAFSVGRTEAVWAGYRSIGLRSLGLVVVMGPPLRKLSSQTLHTSCTLPEHIRFADVVIMTGALPYTTARALTAAEEYWASGASDERKGIREANHRALAASSRQGRSASDTFLDEYEADVPYRFFDPRFDMAPLRAAIETDINMAFVGHFWGSVLKDFDRTPEYGHIQTPVLVIAGRYDFGAPYYLWNEVGGSIPDFTFHLFERAGHNPMVEVPAEFDRVVIDWLRRKG
jgi:proline iminopeptidase